MFNKKTKEVEDNNIDLDFISRIENHGGLSFNDERIITGGDGYSVILRVYQFPDKVYGYWLSKIMNIEDSIVSIDIYTHDKDEVVENINRSFNEQEARFGETNKRSQMREARTKMEELDELLAEVHSMNQTVKAIIVRLYLGHISLDALEVRIHDIVRSLEKDGFKLTVDINETENNFKSFMQPVTDQKKQVNKIYVREGQPVTSSSLAKGLPFNFAEKNDPNGTFLGQTKSGGVVTFDHWEVNDYQTNSDILIAGNRGSGKSTTLKKIASTDFYLGNNSRIFDFMGDFTYLAKYVGGRVIYMDGTENNAINVLEIMMSPGPEGAITNAMLMRNHLDKCGIWLQYNEPILDTENISFFKTILRQFYKYLKMDNDDSNYQLVGRDPHDYPILSDWVEWAKEISVTLNNTDRTMLERLTRIVTGLIDQYGEIVNRHTTIRNLAKSNFIVFNMMGIKNNSETLFNSQFYLAFTVCIDDATFTGMKMRKLYDSKEIDWWDIVRTSITVDEMHRIVNTSKPLAVKQMLSFMREIRHIFTAINGATQSINDMILTNDPNSEDVMNIKTLFSLFQYKIIMKQDQSSVAQLRQTFGSELTDDMYKHIPYYGKGECTLVTSGVSSLEMKVYISELEEDIFRGGA